MKKSIFTALGAATLLLSFNAYAAASGGCESFAWPVTTELQWLKAADSEAVISGSTLKELPAKAVSLSLLPMDKVAFPVAPTSRRKNADGKRYGGMVTFDSIGDPGIYQVSLPVAGWIDVVQGGKTIKPAAHTSKMDCDGVRKSVRFDIGPGPVAIEISGIPADTVKFAIRRGE
ncbi:hypothetical protein HYPDE_40033 [Hyphomicrobium denitrificans 1NES1]|uniref:Uncharacterized protein n=1 Tax=Hyphomicrobium denitrificans 1NES1 TaxID=670307 RepID=N0BHP2_9HYPH|nr:hypothetical protein [Hyphomicrobium denitrificans]AGK59675.1 hypothetical protein HYPDE_40033 [Hyphomicrobium denitrificans 1NES1]